MASSALARSRKVWLAAQGMAWRTMKSLEKDLLPSSLAVAALWPKTGIPSSRKASASPATSGTSGPMITRSGRASRAQAASAGTSSTARGRQVPSWPRASLPGAAHSSTGVFPPLSFKAMACSRPPEPIKRIFIRDSLLQVLPRLNP